MPGSYLLEVKIFAANLAWQQEDRPYNNSESSSQLWDGRFYRKSYKDKSLVPNMVLGII